MVLKLYLLKICEIDYKIEIIRNNWWKKDKKNCIIVWLKIEIYVVKN